MNTRLEALLAEIKDTRDNQPQPPTRKPGEPWTGEYDAAYRKYLDDGNAYELQMACLHVSLEFEAQRTVRAIQHGWRSANLDGKPNYSYAYEVLGELATGKSLVWAEVGL